jgi:hypothetical protein
MGKCDEGREEELLSNLLTLSRFPPLSLFLLFKLILHTTYNWHEELIISPTHAHPSFVSSRFISPDGVWLILYSFYNPKCKPIDSIHWRRPQGNSFSPQAMNSNCGLEQSTSVRAQLPGFTHACGRCQDLFLISVLQMYYTVDYYACVGENMTTKLIQDFIPCLKIWIGTVRICGK